MPLLLFTVFIAFPLLELLVILQVGDLIGVLPTIGLLLASGLIGGPLAASQGRAVWRRFNEALAAGRAPAREVFDGVCVIFAGALLVTPGFITDVLGISLLLPPARAVGYRLLTGRVKRAAGAPVFVWTRVRRTGPSGPPPHARPRRPYDVDGTARELDEPRLPSSPPGGEQQS
jgi:UPF0716 protein FxsA